ncbi:MAG: DUF6691 family protein [Chloroflexota bacterium]
MKLLGFGFGLGFGAVITAGRFNEYNVIHDGLRLTNLYMFFAMASAIVVAMPLLYILRRAGWVTPLGGKLELSPSRIERKHILGGVVFGVGWAVTGTCPAPALAMAGSGGILGLVVVIGIFCGLMLRDSVVAPQSPSTSSTQASYDPEVRHEARIPAPVDL